MADEISITFDEQNKIRVLDADKFRETEQLKIDSMDFIKKVLAMDEVVQNLNESLEEYAKKIEIEKLRAIGERNKVETEQDNRKKKLMELSNILNEKKAEYERYQTELDALVKVEQDQRILIEKLSNNEAA